jgi:hypothetical protein
MTVNNPGSYGSKGVTSTSNMISSRVNSVMWVDNANKFWIFGGNAYINSTCLFISFGKLTFLAAVDTNELWSYDGTSWTWIDGHAASLNYYNWGSKQTPSPGNWPNTRFYYPYWLDSSGSIL